MEAYGKVGFPGPKSLEIVSYADQGLVAVSKVRLQKASQNVEEDRGVGSFAARDGGAKLSVQQFARMKGGIEKWASQEDLEEKSSNSIKIGGRPHDAIKNPGDLRRRRAKCELVSPLDLTKLARL